MCSRANGPKSASGKGGSGSSASLDDGLSPDASNGTDRCGGAAAVCGDTIICDNDATSKTDNANALERYKLARNQRAEASP